VQVPNARWTVHGLGLSARSHDERPHLGDRLREARGPGVVHVRPPPAIPETETRGVGVLERRAKLRSGEIGRRRHHEPVPPQDARAKRCAFVGARKLHPGEHPASNLHGLGRPARVHEAQRSWCVLGQNDVDAVHSTGTRFEEPLGHAEQRYVGQMRGRSCHDAHRPVGVCCVHDELRSIEGLRESARAHQHDAVEGESETRVRLSALAWGEQLVVEPSAP
jgi:hypothetical protein